MSKKKSLGHNPLAYSTRRHASFDFITPAEDKDIKEDSSGDDEEMKVNRTTASYYLEEPLVEKVRNLANQKEMSYSALVNEILKNALRDISTE